jgi:UDP-N-acetylglucosamine 3-dehydrogenase
MTTYRAGVIGCGGRGRAHAEGYVQSDKVEIVACADPIDSTRGSFTQDFSVAQSYADYRQMLAQEELDFVSVCTWTGQHREMIEAAAAAGVRAIHSEKPMAPTWGDSRALYQACVDRDVVITFCHQRRFGAQFVKAKQLLDEGAIGQLQRLEGGCSNLFDWGTHWFDMFFYYNDDAPAEWVMGQIAVEAESQVFGVALETSGISWVRWQNGVEGLLATGHAMLQGPRNRLCGSNGIIEVGGQERAPLRLLRKETGRWEDFSDEDLVGTVAAGGDTVLSVLDLIDAVETGREPELSGRKALQATELIFATYESSRRRSRIVLPLDVDDSALLTMIEEGTIGANR